MDTIATYSKRYTHLFYFVDRGNYFGDRMNQFGYKLLGNFLFSLVNFFNFFFIESKLFKFFPCGESIEVFLVIFYTDCFMRFYSLNKGVLMKSNCINQYSIQIEQNSFNHVSC